MGGASFRCHAQEHMEEGDDDNPNGNDKNTERERERASVYVQSANRLG